MDTNKSKPKYSMGSTVLFMVRTAFERRPSVLWLCLAHAVVMVAASLAELIIAPAILSRVEAQDSLESLLLTVFSFGLALMFFKALNIYVGNNTQAGRITVRLALVGALHSKLCNTSLPNAENPDIIKKLELATEAVNSNASPGEAIWNTLTNLLRDCISFIIYLFLLSGLDPVLMAVVTVTGVVGFFVNNRINRWGYDHREEVENYSKVLSYINRKSSDGQLAKDIRIFSMGGWLKDVYAAALRLYDAFFNRRERVFLWTNIVDLVLTLARNGIAYTYLIAQVLSGGLTAPLFLLYFSAVGSFTAQVTGLLNGFTTLNKSCLGIAHIREFLDMAEPFRFENGKPLPCDPNGRYELALDHVSFRYPGAEKDIFHDLCLTLRPGEKLAVVGLNGAGKTTLVKLLCGFYDPTEGRVLLNGQDIRQYNRRDYYRLFSAVFQQFSILATTLAENITQNTDAADTDRMLDAAEKAGLMQKLSSLPQGADTHIGREVYDDGILLSGGETQRLMMARALYKDAPFIVLDEPTAALDPIAENDMYMKYNAMTRGRSSIFISHRLASTRFCDRILFLKDGTIAEEGSHDALMALGGLYHDLYQVQGQYYQKEGENSEQ